MNTRSAGNPNESFTWNLDALLTVRGLYSDARQYQYDTLLRLKNEGTLATVTQSFTYDANGNRLTNGTNAYTYLANSNQMATRKGVAITRDAAGNHTNNGLGQTYAWDTQGHYVQFSLNGVQKATYLYNYQHQRVQKTLWNGSTNLGATLYHYDLAGRLLAETNTAGTVQAVYLYDDNGTPLAIVQAANSAYNSTSQDKLVYLQTDHLGTPRLATDTAKRTVWKWESDAFGSTAPVQDPDGDGITTTINLRFAGQYYDAESGLHDNWHRTYDPSLGRYLSSDPIGLDGGMNTFGYVGQSPMVNVDPKGLNAIPLPLPSFLSSASSLLADGPGAPLAGAGLAGYGLGSLIYPHIAEPLGDFIDGAVLTDSFSQPTKPERTAEDEALAEAEHASYHNFCDKSPPETGDVCADRRAKIKWLQRCLDMREQWADKWYPNKPNREINRKNLEKRINKEISRYNNSWQCRDQPLENYCE